MEERGYWLALLRAPGIGPVGFHELLSHFGSPRRLFEEGRNDPRLGEGLRAYLRRPDWEAAERDLAWLEGPARHLLCHGAPDYPPPLATLPGAPPLLFVHGDPALLASPQLAIVGSRNPTPAGRETAFAFARHLARAGLVITSGLALGIDTAAHEGALEGGHTIAVAGTGLDRVYPARNHALARSIVERGGALVSEFPPGTPPAAANFPRRNRIISGLSLGTLVVEAALRSGSLTTARQAAEQGREVFAIPGSIHNPLARGCHRLLKEGAKLVEEASDVLLELAPRLRGILDEEDNQPEPPLSEEWDEEQRRVLEQMGYAPVSVDILVDRTGLTADVVSSILLILELRGYVASTAGAYTRTSKRA